MSRSEAILPQRTNELALLAFLATVAMLFTAFTASYLVRRTGADWRPVALPGILWLNTAVLAASSATMEFARKREWVRERDAERSEAEFARRTSGRRWLSATTVLGLLFLAGQVMAWRALSGAGVYLPSNPHASFFYVLSGVHGVHLLGGIAALLYVLKRGRGLGICAMYWHFLGAVWVYLLLLLKTV